MSVAELLRNRALQADQIDPTTAERNKASGFRKEQIPTSKADSTQSTESDQRGHLSVNSLEFHEGIVDENLAGSKGAGHESDSVIAFLLG